MCLENFDRVFLNDVGFRETLIIVEIDEVGRSIVLTSLAAFRAVSGKVSYFSALKTGVRLVSCGGCVALEVALRTVALVVVGVLSSPEVIASVVSSVVSSRRRPISVYVHGNGGVVHPTRGI